VSGNTDELDD